jgi:hypothetical protein
VSNPSRLRASNNATEMAIARLVPLAAILALPGSAVSVSACGGACTDAGCSDGVLVEITALPSRLAPPLSVRTCLDGHCQTLRFDEIGRSAGGGAVFGEVSLTPGTLKGSGEHQLAVTGTDGRGRRFIRSTRRIELHRVQPNGPGCGPTCRTTSAALEATS